MMAARTHLRIIYVSLEAFLYVCYRVLKGVVLELDTNTNKFQYGENQRISKKIFYKIDKKKFKRTIMTSRGFISV